MPFEEGTELFWTDLFIIIADLARLAVDTGIGPDHQNVTVSAFVRTVIDGAAKLSMSSGTS